MVINKYPQDLVLEDYGVKLKRLTHDKIEMLRQWRNDPKIQQYMFYRETITPEMQERWFQKINNDHNFYFIIEYEGKEIGCVDIKDVDYENKCGEPGLFIYNDEYLESSVSWRAMLCLNQFIWNSLELLYLYIHVIETNTRALQFNTIFGYEPMCQDKSKDNNKYVLTRQKAMTPSKKLLKVIEIIKNE